jgi:electron transfer flavoprotein alpha/beta subunit
MPCAWLPALATSDRFLHLSNLPAVFDSIDWKEQRDTAAQFCRQSGGAVAPRVVDQVVQILRARLPVSVHVAAHVSDDRPAPCEGFTAEQDARLRDYMARDMGIGSSAKMLNMPRAKVEARWNQMKAALAQVPA